MKIKTLLLITTFAFSAHTFAQQSLGLYNMNSIGQSTQINPSLLPDNKLYVGIPVIGSTSFMFSNSGFTWRDLHRIGKDDSITFDFKNAVSKLAANNFITLSLRASLLETGFHVGNNYITLNVAEKANMNFTFPKELFQLLLEGNGQFIGQEIDLHNMSFDLTHYREYAIGFARPVNEKLSFGTRVKYLYGMENYSSAKNHLSFYTAPDDYTLQLSSSYTVNTSSSANQKENSASPGYAFGFKNTGFAGDISATYKATSRFSINASVIDIGYINWKSNVKSYVAAEGSYSFSGMNLNDFMSDSSSGFEGVMDSLSSSFEPSENKEAYKTKLPTHLYINGVYSLNEKTELSALIHAQTFKGTIQPTFTASINRDLSGHISGIVSYSVINHHFDNVGAGVAVRAGALQFFMMSDNLIGTINPLSNHTAQFQFGFNLVYGRMFKRKTVTDFGVQNKSIKTDTSTSNSEVTEEKVEEKPETRPR